MRPPNYGTRLELDWQCGAVQKNRRHIVVRNGDGCVHSSLVGVPSVFPRVLRTTESESKSGCP